MKIDTTPAAKLKINLAEYAEAEALALAAAPTTVAEVDATLCTVRAIGKSRDKCYKDETAALRPRLLRFLPAYSSSLQIA